MALTLKPRRVVRIVLTVLIVLAALLAVRAIWNHYMHDPWTRDGRIRADIVNLSTDVSGLVGSINVEDNHFVHQGEVLFTIDRQRYQLALDQAQANLEQLEQERDEAKTNYERRRRLQNYVSAEDRQNARFTMLADEAAVRQAKVRVRQAKLDLERSTVEAPVDGYVTNQNLRVGEYVNAGSNAMTLVDAHSFYALGYFEETKLAKVHVGAPARIQLLSSDRPIRGHVESYAHGITDSSLSSQSGNQSGGLASVNASFDWVRLSQRIPVRIALDRVPDDVKLSAGLTATIYLDAGAAARNDLPDWLKPLRHWWEQLVSI
ncbi:RND family efflux transporter MFP subunit [Kushneria sinocarnis]|uniref:RND family efflux transporter MFP subunit n=1 Tax=Kushneria sinocarnis TaxID=595502 RepID=A0A420X1H3_9GAMM|nr:HlyD family secretion protein [Kushneria sinocarnis]RKR07525.1 RND family efflux transporter MFP subunit [Kushneria sinocarnis]